MILTLLNFLFFRQRTGAPSAGYKEIINGCISLNLVDLSLLKQILLISNLKESIISLICIVSFITVPMIEAGVSFLCWSCICVVCWDDDTSELPLAGTR